MNLHCRMLCGAGAALMIAACAQNEPSAADGTITADIGVRIVADGSGGYEFAYSGEYSDARGNLDFSKGAADVNAVLIAFSIDDAPPGLRFMPEGPDAIWIVEKENVGPDGSPEGPFKGEQFSRFAVDEDGRRLQVYDRNDDEKLYRYGLRFDLAGETIVDDPDMQNGGGGGHN